MQRTPPGRPGPPFPSSWLLRSAVAAVVALASASAAANESAPEQLLHQIVAPWATGALAPAELEAEDYLVRWEGPPLPGVTARVVAGSLEWVRVADTLLVAPRLLVELKAEGVTAASVRSAGSVQPLRLKDGVAREKLLVAGIAGSVNPVELSLRRGGEEQHGVIVLAPAKGTALRRGEVHLDASCSHHPVEVEGAGLLGSYAYVGCGPVYNGGPLDRTGALELLVLWDVGDEEVTADGLPLAPAGPGVYRLRLAGTHSTELAAGTRRLDVRAELPERAHFGSVGLGAGPYLSTFEGDGENRENIAPLFTLYGSYRLSRSSRLAAFGAYTLSERLESDFGLYLDYESFRLLDRRLSVNLLIGAHALGFRTSDGGYQIRFGGPQGVEVAFHDLLARGYTGVAGSFLYPLIFGKQYSNVWLRYGPPGLFAEVNFIEWREALPDGSPVRSRSFGVSVGASMLPFL